MNNEFEKDNLTPEENNDAVTETKEEATEEVAPKDFEFLGDPTAGRTYEQPKASGFRRFAPVIALCVIAVLLFTSVIVLKKAVPESEETTTEEEEHVIPIFDFTGSSGDRLDIKNTNDEFAFVKRLEKTFCIEGKEDYPVANATILSVLSYVGSLEAESIVEVGVTDFAQYGLDNPFSTVTWTKGDEVHYFEIGNLAASGDYYLRADGGDTVYTVASDVATYFLSPRMDFYDTALFDFDSDNDSSYIEEFTIMQRGNEDIVVELQDLADDSLESAYLMLEPIEHSFSVTVSYYINTLMSNLTSLTVYDDDTSAENLAKYGLDDPSYGFSFTNVQEVNTIYFGDLSDEGYYYAYAEGHDFIYIIDEETINILTYDVASYCETMSYTRSYDTIDKMRIIGGGKTYEIDITGTADEENLKAYVNDKYVEYDSFATLYAHIISIEIKEVGSKQPTDELLVTIEVDCIDGTTDVLKYYKQSDLNSFYELNGEGRLIVSTSKVEQILEFSQKLYDGEEIIIEW